MNTLMTLDSENHQLKKPAELVDFKNDPVDEWTFELIREMNTHNGVGIAGPQIGINKRIAIVKHPKTEESIVLLNPELFRFSADVFKSTEGCLSLPNKYYTVYRRKYIKVYNYKKWGERYTISTMNKEYSRRLQHEVDHLNGILICNKGRKYDIQGTLRNLSQRMGQ